ncbi:MAG: tetratricopeptide repeat protein [Bacteroidetes bacterium]|nr:tetratricopeptide repeat protein [Bacteroidota bacterium]
MKTKLSFKYWIGLLVFLPILSWAQPKTELDRLFDQGIAHYNQGEYNQAASAFEQARQLAKKQNNTKLFGKANNNLGNVYSLMGQSEKALSHYLSAMEISRQLHDTLVLAKTIKNIGALYEEQKDFKTAMQYYRQALDLASRKKDQALIADCLNNQGVVYEQLQQYEKALEVYDKSLSIYRQLKDFSRVALALNNSAIVEKYLKHYPESVSKYQESLALSERNNDRFMVAATQNNLGNVYQLMGNSRKALEWCLKASQNAKAINAPEILIETYDGIALAYEKLGLWPQAVQYRKWYEAEKDRFINANRSSQLIEMQTKYETKKKEDEIVLLRQQEKIKNLELSEKQSKIERRNVLLIVNVLLLLGLVVLAYFWRSRQKLQDSLNRERLVRETEELERLRIAKDIHDDLGSGLSKINFLSELISKETAVPFEVKNYSQAVRETSVRMIENMRDLIWALNPENTTLANLISRMREYASDYLEDYQIQITYQIPDDLPQTCISKESHRGLFMIVKETLNNIGKYAQATEVQFKVVLHPETLQLLIRDNGIGFDAGNAENGNGLRNMKSRVEALDGSFKLQSNIGEGTQIEVQIALKKIIKLPTNF